MSDVSDALFRKKGLGARVTLRLSERELAALKELAEAREGDLTSVIREAIGAYLHQEKAEAAHRHRRNRFRQSQMPVSSRIGRSPIRQ